MPGLRRDGAFDGTTSIAKSRGDRIDFAVIFNRRVSGSAHNDITNAIEGYLDTQFAP
jgi:hypothetical protein